MSIITNVALLRNPRTKIVATLGPASRAPKTIEALMRSGVNVFRLNFSHGTHEEHREEYGAVRAIAAGLELPVGVLADLSGPKIRVGRFAGGGIDLVGGEPVTITVRDVEGGPGLIPSQYDALADDVSPGDAVLLADGVMQLRVESIDGSEVRCSIVQGGRLTDRKGINLPGVEVSAPCLTEKDRDDARFAVALGVDFLALSFVRRGADIHLLRELVGSGDDAPAIIAKIERPEALANSEEILAAADGVMVARGDLGVELPPEQVPIAQQQLIDQARRRGKPVIVATQMLESMVENSRPTRAEVTDVSHSVANGADAVMLSAETASGRYPVEAVEMMARIGRQTEAHMWQQGAFGTLSRRESTDAPLPFGDAVARATALLSRDLRVRAVMALSEGGMSAATMSMARPAAPVVAISSRVRTYQRMSLLWGMIPVLVESSDLEDPVALVRELAGRLELAAAGEFVLMVRGFHAHAQHSTPTITLLTV